MHFEHAKAQAEVLKALGNPVRLIVVQALSEGDLSAGDLNRRVPVRQPTLSRHLTVLKKAGIVTERRAGPRVIHHLETPCILRAFGDAEEVLRSHARRRDRLLKHRPS
jgi:ArsR family transcriptional regulator